MSERTAENRITRINNSPIPKFILPMLAGVVTGNVMESSLYNALGVGAGWAIAESEIKFSDFQGSPFPFRRGIGALLTRGLGLSVIVQVPLILDGRPDLGIYIPLAIGAVGGQVIHLGAKALYDSGLTKPIYRVLRIQDRRLTSSVV